MELYIIRHANPDYAHDTITEFGKKEAESLVPFIKDISPDLIYASPMGRAQDTAAPSCRELNKTFEILPWTGEDMAYMQMPPLGEGECGSFRFGYEDGFSEVNDFSDYENRPEKLAKLAEGSDALIASLGYRRVGGWYEILEPNDKKVCVFCHGGFGSAWIAYLMGIAPTFGWHRFRLDTASVTKFVFYNHSNGRTIPYCQYLNNESHEIAAGLRGND